MSQGSNFVDYVKICCRSGHGGAGSAHLHRDILTSMGGPDGGDGGRGGHVIVKGNAQLWTLLHLKFRKHVIAGDGDSGGSSLKSGKTGRDEILEVRSVCREILVAPHVQELAIQLVMATQPEQTEAHELAKKYIRYGSSPRGAQALVECGRVRALMRGRYHLSTEDIEAVALSVLRHRIILNFDGHAEGQTPDSILTAIVREATALASTA